MLRLRIAKWEAQCWRGICHMVDSNRGEHVLRVLVVEDEALICMTLQDLLEDLGCEVAAICTTLQQAKDYIRRDDFDVAILDVNLNGEEITPVSAALHERGIPFIFSTGYGKDGAPGDFKHYPLIEKPFRDTDVESSLNSAMKGKWKRPSSSSV
jgi:DNA-binding NtrC family response regulator